MRTLLICHHDAPLDRAGIPPWLGSFTTFAGSVVIREPRARAWKRIRREVARVGVARAVDVAAFRLHYRLVRAAGDRAWERRQLARLRARFPAPAPAPELVVPSPNTGEAEAFIRERQPDLVVARCKTLLKASVYSIPRLGTFVMHPGICPEYRNAHGCFWAAVNGDRGNVGMTLLRVDAGVDTGPVFGYFRVDADADESHVVTQHRVVLEHLDAIRDRLLDIEAGTARPIDTSGRRSAAWGQPWLSAWIRRRSAPRPASAAASSTPRARASLAAHGRPHP
jgi:hypothetical protein